MVDTNYYNIKEDLRILRADLKHFLKEDHPVSLALSLGVSNLLLMVEGEISLIEKKQKEDEDNE